MSLTHALNRSVTMAGMYLILVLLVFVQASEFSKLESFVISYLKGIGAKHEKYRLNIKINIVHQASANNSTLACYQTNIQFGQYLGSNSRSNSGTIIDSTSSRIPIFLTIMMITSRVEPKYLCF